MSVSRPARCILSAPSVQSTPRLQCRYFHTSLSLCERRRPKFPNVKASDMGLVTARKSPQELFQPYSNNEKALLAKRYTPAQLEAIEAGEQAIRPEDLDRQGSIRTDLGALPYLDDLSIVKGIIDKRPKLDDPVDPNARIMTEDEYWASVHTILDKVKEENPSPHPDDPDFRAKLRPNRVDFMRAIDEAPNFMGTNGPFRGRSVLAPKVPKAAEDKATKRIGEDAEEEEADPRDPDGIYDQLRKQTGYTLDEVLDFKVKILERHRVVNQTRLGKISSLYCLAIAGNGNGRLGLGQAKGQDAESTPNLARIAAIRNMRPIPRYEDRTLFGDVKAKVSAVEVKLMSKPPGYGLRCQHNIFEMAKAAGIHDLAARVPRSRNKMNTIKATYQALMSQRIPDEVARGRGKKLVDVRKVYYGGRV